MNAGSHVDSRVSTALLLSLSIAFAGCTDAADDGGDMDDNEIHDARPS